MNNTLLLQHLFAIDDIDAARHLADGVGGIALAHVSARLVTVAPVMASTPVPLALMIWGISSSNTMSLIWGVQDGGHHS